MVMHGYLGIKIYYWSSLSYKVTLIDNQVVRRHADHIHSRSAEIEVVNDDDRLENTHTSVTVNAENISTQGASRPSRSN